MRLLPCSRRATYTFNKPTLSSIFFQTSLSLVTSQSNPILLQRTKPTSSITSHQTIPRSAIYRKKTSYFGSWPTQHGSERDFSTYSVFSGSTNIAYVLRVFSALCFQVKAYLVPTLRASLWAHRKIIGLSKAQAALSPTPYPFRPDSESKTIILFMYWHALPKSASYANQCPAA